MSKHRTMAEPNGDTIASKPRRGLEPEIQAMARLDRILSELPPAAAERVIGWLSSRYLAKTTPTDAV